MANLSMTIGDYRQFQLAVTKNGAPVDLTGIQTLAFQLQRGNGAVLATWGLGGGVAVSSPASAGIAILSVTPAMLAGFVPVNAAYIWSLVDAVGNPTLVLDTGSMSLTLP